MDRPETVEPTLAAMRTAAEAARAANHEAYHAPRTPSSIYDRIATLHDLISKTEQLSNVLGQHTRNLAHAATDGTVELRSTAGVPAERALSAASKLQEAARLIEQAGLVVNAAWSEASTLYAADPDTT